MKDKVHPLCNTELLLLTSYCELGAMPLCCLKALISILPQYPGIPAERFCTETGTFATILQSAVVIAEGLCLLLYHPFFSTHSTANLKVADVCYFHKLCVTDQVKIARPTDLNINVIYF